MALRNLLSIRGFQTSRCLLKSLLSDNYKSPEIWEERLKCPHLTANKKLISSINDKIIMGSELNNVELDVFINIASPTVEDFAQLRESIIQLSRIRKSVDAATIIPSTHHSICRLFLYSRRLPSLVHILQNRVEYGIFPDLFMINILIDETLDKENFVLATKLASFVMLQEEFGLNPMTDAISAFSVIKYIDSKTDFSDWKEHDIANDKIFQQDIQNDETMPKDESTEANKVEKTDDDDEEQDDAEYIRVPFLRNPYEDQHFDLKNGRLICGKTLRMVANSLSKQDKYLGDILALLGSILEGHWSKVFEKLESFSKLNQKLPVGTKEIAQNYIENLHDVLAPSDDDKQKLLSTLELLSQDPSLSVMDKLETMVKSCLPDQVAKDSSDLMETFALSSNLRSQYQKLREEKLNREKLEAEIEAKKEELKAREQYLYFYDNLRKTTLTKLDYK